MMFLVQEHLLTAICSDRVMAIRPLRTSDHSLSQDLQTKQITVLGTPGKAEVSIDCCLGLLLGVQALSRHR